MKTKLLALAALITATSAAAFAAPLTATTAVHTKPDDKSPSVTFLKAGTEPVATQAPIVPSGWMAVELPGPHTAYVQNKDLTKSLDVVPGASLYLAPKPEAGVLTVADKSDKTTIDGVLGKWSRVILEKRIVGYIRIGAPAPALPAMANAPAVAAPSNPAPAPMSSPMPPMARAAAPGQPAATMNLGDGAGSSLPRLFQGRFVSTRRPLAPRRPYDWALNDNAGKRYAYLDISKLLQIEQIEKFADHMVVVYGAAKASPDGKDILIQVESLQLK
ncbi:MAG: hypothetical protein ABIZ81_17840 [Opitutaceae bacterium]